MADPDHTKVQTTDGLTAEQWEAGNPPDGRLRDQNGMIIERPVDGYVSPDRQIRIEALRAASRVVAGIFAGGEKPTLHGKLVSSDEVVIELASDIARYIEKGER